MQSLMMRNLKMKKVNQRTPKTSKMLIPKEITIFGQKIKVIFDYKLVQDDDSVGATSYRTNKIILQKNTQSTECPRTQIEKTFWHEALHMIFYYIGENKLGSNEKFIDLLAGVLHQVITTAKY